MPRKIISGLLFFLLRIGVYAQTPADIDTFTVNGARFIATTPADWFSISVKDSIQKDTTWNYKMRYSPKDNPTKTRAEIWIHIINNSSSSATLKQQREFQKKCAISVTKLHQWSCYHLSCDPEKIKGCKECGMMYTEMYSIPLNKQQFLEILFIGEGQNNAVYPLRISFGDFANQFVTVNYASMSSFRIIDFNSLVRSDSFKVKNFNVKFPYAETFSRGYKEQETGLGCRSMKGVNVASSHRMTSPDEDFSISVVGAIRNLVDTSISILPFDEVVNREVTQAPYGYEHCIKLISRCTLETTSTELIEFTFELKLSNQLLDEVWLSYYENLLRDYTKTFILFNSTISQDKTNGKGLPPLKPINTDPLRPKRTSTSLDPTKPK